jgi:hypothetical protein
MVGTVDRVLGLLVLWAVLPATLLLPKVRQLGHGYIFTALWSAQMVWAALHVLALSLAWSWLN